MGDEDVVLSIVCCGLCGFDRETIDEKWHHTYPIFLGHEIVGKVIGTGPKVTKFRVGNRAGVGYIVDSCRVCANCKRGAEHHCPKAVFTSNDLYSDGTRTRGGLADVIVVNQRYVVSLPLQLSFEDAVPLLCAGITIYHPLRRFGLARPGMHIGVVGIGRLGQTAIKFIKAVRGNVTVLANSLNEKEFAITHGADNCLVLWESEKMLEAFGTFDAILDTVTEVHPLVPLLNLLKMDGKLVMVGTPQRGFTLPSFINLYGKPRHAFEITASSLQMGRKIISGSSIAGMNEMQEMLTFAAERNIKLGPCSVYQMHELKKAILDDLKDDKHPWCIMDVCGSYVGSDDCFPVIRFANRYLS